MRKLLKKKLTIKPSQKLKIRQESPRTFIASLATPRQLQLSKRVHFPKTNHLQGNHSTSLFAGMELGGKESRRKLLHTLVTQSLFYLQNRDGEKIPSNLESADWTSLQLRANSHSWGTVRRKGKLEVLYSLDHLKRNQYNFINFIKKKSSHKEKLLETRNLTALYGPNYKKGYKKISLSAGVVSLLTRKLDYVVKEGFLFKTLRSAQSWIHKGYILVNGQPRSSTSMVKNGDCLSIHPGRVNHYKKQFMLSWAPKGSSLLFTRAARTTPAIRKYICGPRLLARWQYWITLQNAMALGNKRVSNGLSLPYGSHLPYWQDFHHLKRTLEDKRGQWRTRGRARRLTLARVVNYLSHMRIRDWSRRKQRWMKFWRYHLRRRFWFTLRGALLYRPSTNLGASSQRVTGREMLPSAMRAFLRKMSNYHQKLRKKPFHLEVCHRTHTAIFLYSPQKFLSPCTFDFK